MGSDLTSTVTAEGQVSIFIAVDHCSAECIGIHAARRATRFEALEPIRQGVRTCFGAFAEGIATGLELRHDPCGVVGTPHPTGCSPFVADDDQRELAFLGIASSPAFVREPEGNGCVERFIRTLKENLLWVRRGGAPARDRHLGAAADLAQGSGDPEPAHGARGRDLPHQTSSSAKARALCGGARSTTVIAHAPSSCPTT